MEPPLRRIRTVKDSRMAKGHAWELWRPPGTQAPQEVRALIRAVMGLHSTFKNEFWLWRGQAIDEWPLEPGMHTRIRNTEGVDTEEEMVVGYTNRLLEYARKNHLDRVEDLRLPDLALLAHLQHHGAATPLLDVTVDPLVAMWMVAHASGPDATEHDARDGLLFAIRRPPRERWLEPLDSRPYFPQISDAISTRVHWYRAPAISERLRIQRGSFLLGPLVSSGATTLPLVTNSGEPWIKQRIAKLQDPGRPPGVKTQVVAFRLRAGIKSEVRHWLDDRAGLTQQSIYPTPWHKPFLEDFCQSHGRHRQID